MHGSRFHPPVTLSSMATSSDTRSVLETIRTDEDDPESEDRSLTLTEIRRLAAEVAALDARVVLLHGTAQQAKVCVGIQALLRLAREHPGIYLCRMLTHHQTEDLSMSADDPQVRDVMSRLRKKREVVVGESRLLLDTARSRTKRTPIDGAVIYCAEAFARYADDVRELVRDTTGKVLLATWTDNADMSWLAPVSPRCFVVHTHVADYHARMLELSNHMSEEDYERGALRPSAYVKPIVTSPKPRPAAHRLARDVAAQNPYVHIDPGFINIRLCATTFRTPRVLQLIEHRNSRPNPRSCVMHHHRLVELALDYCRTAGVPTLSDILPAPIDGTLFSSIETIRGNGRVYREARVRFPLKMPYRGPRRVSIEFGTEHFVADTGKTEAGMTSRIAIIGTIARADDKEVVVYPIIMGHPTLSHPKNEALGVNLLWEGPDWYWTPAELIDEFSRAAEAPLPAPEEWQPVMRSLPEAQVKQALCNLLGETPTADWGGEQNDLFSAGVHLGGRRTTAAFVLKGPAGGRKFKTMTPAMLGKNADQIYRLAQSPAQMLVVQHCHDIDEAVRATLGAFAQNLGRPRRYCLIDGRDTYRILKAYGQI